MSVLRKIMKTRHLLMALLAALLLMPGCDNEKPRELKIIKQGASSRLHALEEPGAMQPLSGKDRSVKKPDDSPSSRKKGADPILKIGVMDDYFPYVRMLPGEQPEGFDIEVTRELMRRTGLAYEFVSVKWNKALQDLKIGDLSMLVIAAITPDRRKIFDFTEAYASYDIAFFELQSATERILAETPEELIGQMAEKKVGIPTGYSALEEMQHYKDIRIITAPDDVSCFRMLLEGRVDTIVLDKFRGLYIIKQNRLPIRLVRPVLTLHPYGFALYKGLEPSIVEKCNRALAEMKADGAIASLYARWFAVDESNQILVSDE